MLSELRGEVGEQGAHVARVICSVSFQPVTHSPAELGSAVIKAERWAAQVASACENGTLP